MYLSSPWLKYNIIDDDRPEFVNRRDRMTTAIGNIIDQGECMILFTNIFQMHSIAPHASALWRLVDRSAPPPPRLGIGTYVVRHLCPVSQNLSKRMKTCLGSTR